MGGSNENKAVVDLRLMWSVVSFSILLALAGLGAFASTQQRIAVLETENTNNAKMFTEIKTKLTNIEAILMNPVREWQSQ